MNPSETKRLKELEKENARLKKRRRSWPKAGRRHHHSSRKVGLDVSGVKTLYREPGSLWENTYSETFIRRFGD
jgi:hypothetical protein